jgi:hypothetical protein
MEVDEVGDLVRDDEPPRRRRGEDQPPAVADPPVGRAAAPARVGVADRHRARSDPGRGRDLGGLARQRVDREALEKGLDAPRKGAFRSAATQLVVRKVRRARFTWRPHQTRITALDWNPRAGSEGLAGKPLGDLRVDPFALLDGPRQSRPAAGSKRTGQGQHAAALVEPQPQPAGAAHGSDLHGHRQAGVDRELLRAPARRHDIPGPPHRPR